MKKKLNSLWCRLILVCPTSINWKGKLESITKTAKMLRSFLKRCLLNKSKCHHASKDAIKSLRKRKSSSARTRIGSFMPRACAWIATIDAAVRRKPGNALIRIRCIIRRASASSATLRATTRAELVYIRWRINLMKKKKLKHLTTPRSIWCRGRRLRKRFDSIEGLLCLQVSNCLHHQILISQSFELQTTYNVNT